MSIFAIPAQHRRLPYVIALSLSLHVLAITCIDMRLSQAPATAGSPVLSVRLAHAAHVAEQARPPASAVPVAATPLPTETAPVPEPSVAPLPPPSSEAAASSSDVPSAVVVDVPTGVVAGQEGLVLLEHMPGLYRIDSPPSARIRYALVRTTPDGAGNGEGEALLDWDSDGLRYRLRMDGVLGELESEGDIDDTGVAPRRAVEALGAGSASTLFERDTDTIVAASGTHQLVPGSQDMGSLLAQLAGIGAADPLQMQGVLEFRVAGATGARTERFDVIGPETLATGAGTLDTVRLARQGETGQPRFEVWLAPAHRWLPVQLRVTDADGSARTQTLAAFERAPVEDEG